MHLTIEPDVIEHNDVQLHSSFKLKRLLTRIWVGWLSRVTTALEVTIWVLLMPMYRAQVIYLQWICTMSFVCSARISVLANLFILHLKALKRPQSTT